MKLVLAGVVASVLMVGAAGSAVAATNGPVLTKEDFARAASVGKKYHDLERNVVTEAHWVEGESVLLYGETTDGKLRFHLFDTATGQTADAFDQARVAGALAAAQGREVKADELPIRHVELAEHRKTLRFDVGYDAWTCDLQTYRCEAPHDAGEFKEDPNLHPEERNSSTRVLASPKGQLKAMVVNYNVALESADGKQTTVLSTDGSEGNYYDFESLRWSPDGRHLSAYRVRPGYRRVVKYVDSSPKTQLQPLYPEVVYTKPGDVLDLQQPVLFDVEAKRETEVETGLFPNPFELSGMKWWADGRGFTFEYNARGHQVFRVIDVDAATGKARTMVEETSRTFVDYRRLVPSQEDTGKVFRQDLEDGREMLWASERDGWEHLYLIDGQTGAVKQQVTRGPWVVRSVDRVDEARKVVWFSASGRNAGEDPYFVHAYRVGFDGSGLAELTPEPGNHRVGYTDDGAWMFDLASTVETPPVLQVRRVDGSAPAKVVARGDASAMLAAGWRAPEPFHAMGRDGRTEIWGVVWKPAHLDAKRRYPVVEDIYAGPQGSFVPKTFSARVEPLTELGFAVVQIDGMGTNNRSRAFHDVAWQNLKDAGFPDRILWHKAYAAGHPWYDLSRVGIFGTSAGGQSAMGALLFHPEFYKAAVANSGCHDNRMDKIWWNEQWMGWPIGPQYAASSNVDNAWRLQGRLMLVVGELDDNVDPASTFQVVDRLEKANKEFDLLYVPGGRHGAGGTYGQRKLQSFFARTLLDATVPLWNEDAGGGEAATK